MRGIASVVCFLVVLAFSASCQSGGGLPEPAPADVWCVFDQTVASHATAYAGPGTADPDSRVWFGWTVDDIYSAMGHGSYAKADGSFAVTVGWPSTNSAYKHPDGGVVRYTVNGHNVDADVQWVDQASLIMKPLFSTGAGPNDMLYGDGGLYIANSMDNTAVRYGLDGAVLSQEGFAQAASPSYLALGAGALYTTCNGTNELVSRGAPDLTASAAQAVQFDAAGAAFLGPAQPALLPSGVIAVALNNITGFSPTVYGTGELAFADFGRPSEVDVLALPHGVNAQYVAYDATRELLYVVCAGDIQFDESFVPHATGDAYLEVVDPLAQSVVDSINLGPIGAGRIALSPDVSCAYFGSALSGNVYKVDLASRSVLRGADDPITVTDEYTFISDLAFSPDGHWLLATSFNTDELYVIDPATDEVNPAPYVAPFDLSLDPQLLAGCVNVEVDPTPRADGGYNAYVLYAVANAVAKVELLP